MYSINMGRETFASSSGDLSLTLHSTIDLLLPPDDQTFEEPANLEEALKCREIWIDQSAEVQIYLNFDAEPALRSQLTTFISDIGFRLYDSQMWTDLSLAPLFKSCDHHVEGFRLHFGLRKHTGPFLSLSPKLSRNLAQTQVLPDCVPPPSIPRAELSTVRINLEYRQPSPIMQLSLSPPQYGMLTPQSILEMSFLETNTIVKATQGLSKGDRMKPLIPILTPVVLPPCEASFIDELHHIGEETHPPEFPYPYITPLQTASPSVQPKELYTLLNCGIKRLLTGSNHQKWNQSEGLQSLSQTAPPVFSPGYREAMNHRAQFIPSLARSIASALTTSRNKSLHNIISNLGAPHRSTAETLPPTQSSAEQRSLIQVSLWRIAQKRLYNPKSSQHLSPIDPDSTPCSKTSSLHDMLLSETASDRVYEFGEEFTADYDDTGLDIISDQEELNFDETEDENSIMDFDDVVEISESFGSQHYVPGEIYHVWGSIDSSPILDQNVAHSSGSDILEDILS